MIRSPWHRKRLDELVQYFHAKDVKNKEVFDYDLNKKAAHALALACDNGEPCFLLSFGIPGTGKSGFPYN